MTNAEKITIIERALNEGKQVYLNSLYYTVIRSKDGELLIRSSQGTCIGLYWTDDDGNINLNFTGDIIIPVTVDDIKPTVKFKTPTGTVFVVDSVDDVDGDIMVRGSLQDGEKGRYRDGLQDFIQFLNEEKAIRI